jgi:Mitochondrial carrier protein
VLDPDGNHGKSRGRNTTNTFLSGVLAGAVNACVLNPLSVMKYRKWGNAGQGGNIYSEILHVLRISGGSLRPFANGLLPTIYRDVVFGGCYTYMRLELQYSFPSSQPWQTNMIAAGVATALSGPFNYVRNIQYGTKSNARAPSTYAVLVDLARETCTAPRTRMLDRLVFLCTKLRVGWGTVRVYDYLHKAMSSWSSWRHRSLSSRGQTAS